MTRTHGGVTGKAGDRLPMSIGPQQEDGGLEKAPPPYPRSDFDEDRSWPVAGLALGGYDERGEGTVMTGILNKKRQAIADVVLRHGVVRLDAFGSALRDDFRSGESDLDLLVEFGPMEPYDRVDAYFGMLEELRALLGLEIDLVMAGAVKNPYIERDIERTKRTLYAA